jgi:hypothetical protein
MAGSPLCHAASRDIDARWPRPSGSPTIPGTSITAPSWASALDLCPGWRQHRCHGYARRMDRAAARSLDILVEVPQVESQITASVHPQMMALSARAHGAFVAIRATA